MQAADKLIDAIEERYQLLAEYPEAGPARPDIAPDARALTIGRYLVLYRIMTAGVEIARIVHGARLLDQVL